MSTRDTSLDPKIIESAKKHFLEKGFLYASLKDICRDAGVTTGAIYKRYKGKDDLFADVVKPVIDIFDNAFKETITIYKQSESSNNLIEASNKSLDRSLYWIKALLKERIAVKILLSRADGTSFSNFSHNLVEINASDSYQFMKNLEKKGLCRLKMSEKEYHSLVTGYWASVFEIFIHDFTLEEAMEFIPKLSACYGWDNVIEF